MISRLSSDIYRNTKIRFNKIRNLTNLVLTKFFTIKCARLTSRKSYLLPLSIRWLNAYFSISSRNNFAFGSVSISGSSI